MKTHSRFTPFLKKLCLLGVLLNLAKPWAMATVTASQCETLFAKPVEARQLIQAIHNLADLQLNLDMAKAQGVQSPVVTALSANLHQKKTELLKYLEQHPVMSPEHLQERISRHIVRLQNKQSQQNTKDQENESRRRREQEKQIKESVIDGTRAIFHRIEPGSFKMGEVGEQVDVTLTKPFEMMATPTTQIVWKKVAELANSRFGAKYKIDVDPSHFKGDTHPVEQVFYEDIQTWINGLNELSQAGEPSLADVIPSHKKGDVYRLPSEAEWEFVVRGRGQYNDTYHFGNQESQLGDHAWYSRNSGKQTHPVGQKKPLVINDREFHDMHGNVREWVHDWYGDELPGGTDPQGPNTGSDRVVRGGGWGGSASGVRSGLRDDRRPGNRYNDVGFRLVRTAK